MESNPNDLQNSVLQTVQPTKKKGVSQKILLIIIAILLFLLLALALFFLYKNGTFDTLLNKKSAVQQEDKEKEDSTTQNKEENNQPKESYYAGKTVKALLPEGWSIEEYYNGEGTDSLVEGVVYDGFTGLKIKKGTEEIFSVRAVSGIGFIGCPMYAKFSDYNPADLELNQSMADEIGEPMNITDYTSTQYSEFKWLDRDFRRIGLTYFYDQQPNNNYFEAPCVSGVLTIDGLNFTDTEGFTGEAYFYGASMNASEEDLLVVDKILDSMTLQK